MASAAALPVSGTGTTMVSSSSGTCQRLPAGPAPCPGAAATDRRCGRPACWPRWRNRSTRRNNGPCVGLCGKALNLAILPSWNRRSSRPGNSDLMLSAKAEVDQGHALAGGGEQRAVLAQHSGRNPCGSRSDHHVAHARSARPGCRPRRTSRLTLRNTSTRSGRLVAATARG